MVGGYQDYDLGTNYHLGKANVVADAESKVPCKSFGSEEYTV
jgi:hypothetical protein